MDQPVLKPLELIIARILAFLPNLAAGLLILAFGLIVAWLVKRLIVRLLIMARIDKMFAKIAVGSALQKGDIRYPIIELIGSASFLLILLFFIEDAVQAWQLTVLSELIDSILLYLPRFFVGLFILAVGILIANLVARRSLHLLVDERIERAYFLSRLIRSWILIFVVALVLVLMNIAPNLVTIAFATVFGALGLSLVLALGMGSREAVRVIWEKFLARPDEESKPESRPENNKERLP